MVLKTARYDDDAEAVEFAELQLFVGERYVVTVRHGEASALSEVRRTIEDDLARIRCGPMAVLHAVIDRVVDDYQPVIQGLDNDMAEIEDAVFATDRPRGFDPSQRIFKLKREVLDFYRNTEPLLEPLGRLAAGQLPGAHPELGTYFRDVEDHLTRAVERASATTATCCPTSSTPTSPRSPSARTTTCARSRPGSPSAASPRWSARSTA